MAWRPWSGCACGSERLAHSRCDDAEEAYAAAGEKDLAIKNYEKSLQLNPNSQGGIEALKKLKGK